MSGYFTTIKHLLTHSPGGVGAILSTCLISLFACGSAAQLSAPPSRPPLGLTARVKILEAYDGDTVAVELRRTMRIRLLDCWAPEVRTRDLDEKRRGLAAKRFLAELAEGKSGTLFVPAGDPDKLGDETSMGRVLGSIWLEGDSKTLAQHVVAAGHATNSKFKK